MQLKTYCPTCCTACAVSVPSPCPPPPPPPPAPPPPSEAPSPPPSPPARRLPCRRFLPWPSDGGLSFLFIPSARSRSFCQKDRRRPPSSSVPPGAPAGSP